MSKFFVPILLIALSTLLFVANAQPPPTAQDRQLCARLNQRCLATNARVGDRDDGVDGTNRYCRALRGPTWRNVNRCQLWRAHCELTVLRCRHFTCDLVQQVIFPRRT